MQQQPNDTQSKTHSIGFGGGCHWCTEAVFQSLHGVHRVQQGWISSESPYNNESEAVIVHYHPDIISLSDLVSIHLYTHSSTSKHSMRKKYRSAVYYTQSNDKQLIQKEIYQNQTNFKEPIITLTLPFKAFRSSPDQYQNYFQKHHDRPFCKAYIHPKLKKIMQRHSQLYRTAAMLTSSTTSMDPGNNLKP